VPTLRIHYPNISLYGSLTKKSPTSVLARTAGYVPLERGHRKGRAVPIEGRSDGRNIYAYQLRRRGRGPACGPSERYAPSVGPQHFFRGRAVCTVPRRVDLSVYVAEFGHIDGKEITKILSPP